MSNLYQTLFNEDNDNHSCSDVSMEIINQLYGHMDLDALSKYYDLSSYNNITSPQDESQIRIIHMNSRSLLKNSDNILSFLHSLHHTPDILAFTETWLTDSNKHLHEITGYHSHHLIRQARGHGGVSIFVSDRLNSTQQNDLTFVNENIEINTIKVTSNTLNFLLCAIYRPNSKHIAVDEFTDIMNTLLQNKAKSNKIILIGDFNINLLEHSTHIPTSNFLAGIQALNFVPHIARPTRFPDSINLGEPSLLDHIYTNFSKLFTSGIIHYPISDHLPIFLNISVPRENNKLHKIVFRHRTQEQKQLFSSKLSSIAWNDLLSSQNININ